jgi:hypothetical protein
MTSDTIIILHTFNEMLEASFALHKLKAKGIDSFIENENVIGLNPIGGVELKIFFKDKERAEKIITE